VEEQAERVDVGRGGDVAADDLLGSGVGGRQQAQLGARRRRVPLVLQELGDAEVVELDLATSERCADSTAAQTSRKSRPRASTPRPAASAWSAIGAPSTRSSTK
jgi:hypothetical protein